MVFMRPITHLRNTITGDEKRVIGRMGSADHKDRLGHLNNAIFHFEKGHPYVRKCLEEFANNYDPQVSSFFGT